MFDKAALNGHYNFQDQSILTTAISIFYALIWVEVGPGRLSCLPLSFR